MKSNVRFNYIITIFNKEKLIRKVIKSVINCCGTNSYIYPVLDGCTDKSEKIVDSLIKKYPQIKIHKLYTANVHELLSINKGLTASDQRGVGFNIVLQDDVVLDDPKLESQVIKLYKWAGKSLGVVSFRLGANIDCAAVANGSMIPQKDFVENAYGHGISEASILFPGEFSYRDLAIKSPICIPFYVTRKIGTLNKELAPYGHDDFEYGIRCWISGYKNGVYGIKFSSDIKWGGTRNNPHPEMRKIINRNIKYIQEKYSSKLSVICKQDKNLKMYNVITPKKYSVYENARQAWITSTNNLKIHSEQGNRHLHWILNNTLSIKLKDALSVIATSKDKYSYTHKNLDYTECMSLSDVLSKFHTPNEIYRYLHYYSHHYLPSVLRSHRKFFSKEMRGFGEDAFHAFWWLLLSEYEPKNLLEIGVYRGQVISAWSLIGKIRNSKKYIAGITPLTNDGDEVSTYLKDLDYEVDILSSFKKFGLEAPTLVKAYSNDRVARKFIRSKKWDLIYIDGSHNIKDIFADYQNCKKNLKKNGILVFDDSSLYFNYQPRSFAFAGHKGPSVVVKKFVMNEMRHIATIGHCNVFKNIAPE